MDGIIDQVRRMPLAEKRRLAEALRQAIAEELASGGGEPDRCPRCGCPAFVRKGRDSHFIASNSTCLQNSGKN